VKNLSKGKGYSNVRLHQFIRARGYRNLNMTGSYAQSNKKARLVCFLTITSIVRETEASAASFPKFFLDRTYFIIELELRCMLHYGIRKGVQGFAFCCSQRMIGQNPAN